MWMMWKAMSREPKGSGPRTSAADGAREAYLGGAKSVAAVVVTQLNVALLLVMSRLEVVVLSLAFEERLALRFEKGWGVPTLLLTGFAGAMGMVTVSGSRRRLSSWIAAFVPIAVLFTVLGRSRLATPYGLGDLLGSWPSLHVALIAAALGAFPGVLCGRRLVEHGKRLRDGWRLVIWLTVLSLITACLFVFLVPWQPPL